MKQIEITANDAGQRLDRFLKKYFCNAPLSGIYKIIRKDLKLNGKRAKEDVYLSAGDVLSFYMTDEELDGLSAGKERRHIGRSFTVAYEDKDIIVVNKPYGLLVHGDASEKKNTLSNQLIDYLIEKGSYIPRLEKSFRPAPAHRLDRNTTGLVVFGKNAAAQRRLAAAFAAKPGAASGEAVSGSGAKSAGGGAICCAELQYPKLRKFYKTICRGRIDRELTLTGYLLKDASANRVRVLNAEMPGSKFIKTIVRPVVFNERFSFVEVELITGRSHQIRAHLSSIGCPVLGDPKYGAGGNAAKSVTFGRNAAFGPKTASRGRSPAVKQEGRAQYLHASKLIIGDITVESELPAEFRAKLTELFGKDTAYI